MIKFLKQLSVESVVDVIGVVALPKDPLIGTTQQVEIQVRKVFCVNRVKLPKLPLNVEDASRSKADIQAGKPGAYQDTRLKYRVIDLRTQPNQAIFRIQGQVQIGFVEIHTPKLIAGSSEGGSAVFKLNYKGKDACLAQSPQLHKQMAICGDFRRIFEIGPVFRAEEIDNWLSLMYDPLYCNSFDVFIRGEEIISGAQRIHDPELLEKRAKEHEINVNTLSTYIDLFRYGASPHGRFGAGLERVVMLFCALDNIRKPSLFPRDPQRLAP
ncbi:unnamed protein product [Arabis nemorensis]|uniref:aspartate--tRNA ligase n=1 Tax=Arabis nemorensis TaxID=586526 RepID=A0A565BD48_9BRAS|nr:unnamed protein product [Arabis nemorensis]